MGGLYLKNAIKYLCPFKIVERNYMIIKNSTRKNKIFLRANANDKIGMGHLMRIESIELMLNKYFECIYLLREEDIEAISFLKNKNIVTIPNQKNLIDESNWIATNYLTGKEIVILDGYNFNTEYQITIRNKCKGVIFIDDIQSFHYVADIVINHALGMTSEKFSIEPYTKLLLGIDYSLLRPSFIKQAKMNISKANTTDFLICMGGADPENISQKIINEVSTKFPKSKINLIIGPANPNFKNLIKSNNNNAQVNILRNLDEEKIAEVMEKSSIAILPPSTMSLEYLCSGGQLYLYLTADNQKFGLDALISRGYAFHYSELLNTDELNIPKQNANKIVDGLSPIRIKNVVEELYNK